MTLYPPRTDSYPDPDPYPLTPNVTPGWTPPQPLRPEPASGMSTHLPLPQPRGRGIAIVAMIFSLLALALGLAPFINLRQKTPPFRCTVRAGEEWRT